MIQSEYAIKNFFALPNNIFNLKLSGGEILVYAYLKRCENRKTHKCYPSYKTIGEAVGMSKNTVRKYVKSLEAKYLIETESTSVFTSNGIKRNGNLMYTLLPFDEAVKNYYRLQMRQLETVSALEKVKKYFKDRPFSAVFGRK